MGGVRGEADAVVAAGARDGEDAEGDELGEAGAVGLADGLVQERAGAGAVEEAGLAAVQAIVGGPFSGEAVGGGVLAAVGGAQGDTAVP